MSILMLAFVITAPSVAIATDSGKAVFIKTTCNGEISSQLLSSLKSAIGASPKYRVVHTMDDDGRMDVVLTIIMKCSEHNSITGVASVFGQAKCFSRTDCHVVVDGSSLRSDLCDSNAAAACGRVLFKAFDDYMSNPLGPKLKVQ